MPLERNVETFLGCDAAYEEAEIVLFGAPFDSTTSYRPGARFGPAAIRHESYGLESVRALSPGRGWRRAYLFLFSLCIPAGAMLAPGAVWTVSDFAIATLTTINLAVLLALRREVREETRRWRKGAS